MTISVGDKAPEFKAFRDGSTSVSLSDYKGKIVVLYFYPKDDTPGCTLEACGFRDIYEHIKKYDAEVIGISKDSVASHEKFKKKHLLPFILVSDEDSKICETYGVWGEKSMYGKKYQ